MNINYICDSQHVKETLLSKNKELKEAIKKIENAIMLDPYRVYTQYKINNKKVYIKTLWGDVLNTKRICFYFIHEKYFDNGEISEVSIIHISVEEFSNI